MSLAEDCIFCRIAAGEVPARVYYADDDVVAFADAHQRAPVHILVIPRRHITSLAAVGGEEAELMGRLVTVAARLATEQGVAGDGFRLVANSGPDGGQEVPHLHFHLLGGRPLGGFA